jgi:nucleotide-binding universal stress UspA family protein
MYRNILVPLDGSAFSELAIPVSAALANGVDASLTLIHVRDLTAPDYRAGDAAGAARPTMFLATVAEDVERNFHLKASTVLLEGNPIDALCDYAAVSDGALIVMSTHGRTGWSRAWLGSTADGVMRHATTPVLMLGDADMSLDGVMGRSLPFRTVIVPLDGTTFAEEVVRHAAAVAEASRSKVILLHVVTPVAPPTPEMSMPYVPPMELSRDLTDSVAARSREYIARVAASLRAAHTTLDIREEVVIGESVAHVIIETAQRRQADCVAMATHGRGLSRLVISSVADKVVRGGPGAVLLIRPPHD